MENTIYSKELIGKRSSEVVNELKTTPIQGVERFIHRMEIAPDDEERLDILAQGRLALILSHNKFSSIEMEPFKKGPDIKMTSEENFIYWEIKRRRPKQEDYELAESGGPSWIRPDRDDGVIAMIRDKLSQLLDGEINMVVIWSNTVAVGSPEIEEACKSIFQEILSNEGTYEKLSGVILVQDLKVDLTLPDEIYLFINEKAARLLQESLIGKLSSFCRCIYKIQQFYP